MSLTLTPMMCARLLQHKPVEQQGGCTALRRRLFEAIIAFYGRTLTVVLAASLRDAAGGAGTLG